MNDSSSTLDIVDNKIIIKTVQPMFTHRYRYNLSKYSIYTYVFTALKLRCRNLASTVTQTQGFSTF
jgi:hypothetical protein